MRARCRCFGGPEQARLITVTCFYFDVCFILRRVVQTFKDHRFLEAPQCCPRLTVPPAPLCFLRASTPRWQRVLPYRLNQVTELDIRPLCLEDFQENLP